MSYLLAFAGFAALIILHEFGHFAAAKAVGMRVEKFSLFFGPMLVKFVRGETTYGIGPIPLGGFVKITGMNPAEEIPDDVAHRAYYRQPVWKRIVVIAAGPIMNLLIAFAILMGLFALHGLETPDRRVGSVEKGQPATGRLVAGDRLLAVDGRGGSLTALSRRIGSHHCAGTQTDGCRATTPVRVTVVRRGERMTLTLTPRYDAKQKRTRVGFAFGTRIDKDGVGRAATRSANTMWRITRDTVKAIGNVFISSKARKQVSGVVGSYESTRQSFEFSTPQALFILAVISLSLAVVNLFPFLPLDGGHIFWALAEKVRGRAIPFSVMERAGVIGFMLIIFLFAVGLSNDIGRLNGQGFGIR